MTDEEIVRAVAEKVLGWHLGVAGDTWRDFADECVADKDPGWADVHNHWQPLERDADACAVLDKMAAEGWEYGIVTDFRGITNDHDKERPYGCEFDHSDPDSYDASGRRAWAEDRRRAICLAALRAKGVEV